jgi:hypothetical protein
VSSAAYLAPVLTPAQIRALQSAVDAGGQVLQESASNPDMPGAERRRRHTELRSLRTAQEVLQRTLQAEQKGGA